MGNFKRILNGFIRGFKEGYLKAMKIKESEVE